MKLFRRRKPNTGLHSPAQKARFAFTGRHPNGTDLIWRAVNVEARIEAAAHNGNPYDYAGVIIPADKFWKASK
jgi:hypothetical protein